MLSVSWDFIRFNTLPLEVFARKMNKTGIISIENHNGVLSHMWPSSPRHHTWASGEAAVQGIIRDWILKMWRKSLLISLWKGSSSVESGKAHVLDIIYFILCSRSHRVLLRKLHAEKISGKSVCTSWPDFTVDFPLCGIFLVMTCYS